MTIEAASLINDSYGGITLFIELLLKVKAKAQELILGSTLGN